MKNYLKNVKYLRHPSSLFLSFLLFIFLLPQIGLAQPFQRDLSVGLRNDPEVVRLQEFFRSRGLFNEEATGNFLAVTRMAAIRFQQQEGIKPSEGYIGPITRRRINALVSSASDVRQSVPEGRAGLIAALMNQIQLLQERLAQLQKQYAEDQGATGIVLPSSSPSPKNTPPVFTKKPVILEQKFISQPFSLGARYAYRVMFDWTAEDSDLKEESFACNPSIKMSGPAAKTAEYYPEPRTTYACDATISDEGGNTGKESISFESPSWLAISAKDERPFPATAESPLKFGNVTFFNGTAKDIHLDQLATTVSDAMDSALNRNREVLFVVRNGSSTLDDMISKTKKTFHSDPVKAGESHKYLVNLPVSLILVPNEEKTISIWIEQLEPVTRGTLQMTLDKLVSADAPTFAGGIDLVLTK